MTDRDSDIDQHLHAPLGLESGVVRLVRYDARWADLYTRESDRIQQPLAQLGLMLTLEHVGSTAVPGLSAKPIIDILAGWHHDGDRLALIDALSELGYQHRGESGIPGREFFRRGDPRQYHLHLAKLGATFWHDHLVFRDLLRADTSTAAAYSALKQQLALTHPRNRAAYIDGKTAFVLECIRKARAR